MPEGNINVESMAEVCELFADYFTGKYALCICPGQPGGTDASRALS